MEKINIAELLKDCPKGMELDCTMYDNVTFDCVEKDNKPICIRTGDIYRYLTKFGTWTFDDNAKCVIFPKSKTTWEGFVPPCKFKDGDILYAIDEGNEFIFILKHIVEHGRVYCYLSLKGDDLRIQEVWLTDYNPTHRLATEEEKQKLFDAIKENGYTWNAETKTLEKLIEPKFKVGDRIKKKGETSTYTITDVNDAHYFCGKYVICDTCDNNWELVSNKFDITTLVPFESRVLVRDGNTNKWKPNFWGFYNGSNISEYPYECCGNTYQQCIPYEGNEHLLGKTDDCDEFYKTW